MSTVVPYERTPFSLVNGGPFYRLMTRLGLTTPLRRMVVCSLLTWAPLVISSAVARVVTSRTVTIPVLLDYASYARFLFAIPLLLLAEFSIARRLSVVITHFATAHLVPKEEAPHLHGIIRDAERWRDLSWVEAAFLGLALIESIFGPSRRLAEKISIWQYTVPDSLAGLTPAGWWYVLVSIPLFQFLLWYLLFKSGFRREEIKKETTERRSTSYYGCMACINRSRSHREELGVH